MGGLTFTAADDEVLISTTERRSYDELLLLMSFELLNQVCAVDLHELDQVGIHADQHMPRVLADCDAGQLRVRMPLGNLFITDEVPNHYRVLTDNNQSFAVW